MKLYSGKLLLIILTLLIFSSCVPHKKTLLLKEVNEAQVDTIPINFNQVNYKIQKGDFLDIQIVTPEKQYSQFFIKQQIQKEGGNELSLSYQVDMEGYIQVLLIDDVFVEGLTTIEIRKLIEKKLSEYFNYVLVSVRLVVFQVTFIGENNSVIQFSQDKINFFDALSKAGGLSLYTNSSRVKLIRKIDESNAKVVMLDISSQDFISSEYFYLQPNDIVYMEPLRAKTLKANVSTVSLVASVLSLVIVMFNVFNN